MTSARVCDGVAGRPAAITMTANVTPLLRHEGKGKRW